MRYQSYWTILEIEPTTDRSKIKKAYAKLAKQFHPEDHPEQFKALQAAYKSALVYAKTQPSSTNQSQFEQELNAFHQPTSFKRNENVISGLNEQEYTSHHEEEVKKKYKSGINDVIVSVSFENQQTNKPLSNLTQEDVVEGMTQIKRKSNIESTKVIFDKTEDNEMQYLLNRVKKMLSLNCNVETINIILSNERILMLFENPTFKNDIEDLIVQRIKGINPQMRNYLIYISQFFSLKKVELAIAKKRKLRVASVLGTITLVVLIAVTMGRITSSRKEAQEKQRQETMDRINPQKDKVIKEQLSQQEETIREMYENYFYDLNIVEEGEGYLFYNEQNQLLSSNVYTDIGYTTTKFLLLKDKEIVHVLNCETETFLPETYVSGAVVKTSIDASSYHCIVVTTIDGITFLINPEGTMLNIDTSFAYDENTTLITIENDIVINVE